MVIEQENTRAEEITVAYFTQNGDSKLYVMTPKKTKMVRVSYILPSFFC